MSLKIAFLTNYPIVDNVDWKKEFIKKCQDLDIEVDVFYGRKDIKSLFLNFLLKKKYSNSVAKKAKSKKIRNCSFFKERGVKVYKYKNLNSLKAINRIKEGSYTYIVTALDQILSNRFIDKVETKILNVHYGLLPDVKGTSSTEWTYFIHNKSIITLHFIDKGIDTGAIIKRQEINLKEGVSFERLRTKIQSSIPNLIIDFLNDKEGEKIENKGGKLYTFMHKELLSILESNIGKR